MIWHHGGRAQQVVPPVPNRFLLIFDTSSEMKRRVPQVQSAVHRLFARDFGGQAQRGDSIGVWTLGAEPGTGRFPLQILTPESANAVADDIAAFVNAQRYQGKADWTAAQQLLNRLVADSERLTVVFFCDGNDEIWGTPFDVGINRIFAERRRERKKVRQPFVLVLRTQLGKYVGCTVNFPPAPVAFPEFPPLPAPPSQPDRTPAPLNPSPRPPPIKVPPLILIGTNAESALPPPAPKPPATNTVAATPKPSVEANGTNVALPRASDVVSRTSAAAPTVFVPTPAGHSPLPPLAVATTEPSPATVRRATRLPAPASQTPLPTAETAAPAHELSQTNIAAAALRQSANSLPQRHPATQAPPSALIAASGTTNLPFTTPQPQSAKSASPAPNETVGSSVPNSAPAAPAPAISQAGAVASPGPENSGADVRRLAAVGIGLLILAGGLTVWMLRLGRRRDSGSLITRSMKKD
ncbi:MAG: hypothetical protein KGJ60_03370 [Verrucomicrobiota bacterium]|nr:hypothetical protein [Verrucomicrobiota bacterium]